MMHSVWTPNNKNRGGVAEMICGQTFNLEPVDFGYVDINDGLGKVVKCPGCFGPTSTPDNVKD